MPLSPALPHETLWPTSMAELAPGERFLVWCFRRWALGLTENNGRHWALVWDEFARQLGAEDGRAALARFARLLKALQCHARRAVRHHQPCCPCLGADEVWVISIVAACQNHAAPLARALAEWMVEPDGAGELLEGAAGLAAFMSRHALDLPRRSSRGAPERQATWPEPHRVTVH